MKHAPPIALTFHGIGGPPAWVEDDEKPYWLPIERFGAILDRISSDPAPSRIAITFDDGNKSDRQAAEMLLERGLRGEFYVLVGRIGRPGYLDASDLRWLRARGMTVGLHGRDHVDWRKLSDDGLACETVAARAELAAILGEPVRDVAIPFGAYDRRVYRALRSQGFDRILTSDRGAFDPGGAVWQRNTITSGTDEASLEAILSARWPVSSRLRGRISQLVRRYLR